MWSIAYPPPSPDPYWGAVTSAVNFCEEDYIITHYIAEFINTLTSAFYIIYGIYGISRYRNSRPSAISPVNWPYWGLISVGLFSGIYHTTLKYHTQMGDEMSMHLATGCVMIQVFTFQRPPAQQQWITWGIIVGLTSFVIYHCVTDEFVLHVLVFFCTTMSVSVKTSRIIKETVKRPEARRKLHRLTSLATANALAAWMLWNIDEHFCSYLTRWKHAVGMPWGILLEFHGYWHLMTAVSAYTFMAMIEYLTSSSIQGSETQGFAYPTRLVLGKLGHAAGESNGHVNGNGYADSIGHINGNSHTKGNGYVKVDGVVETNGHVGKKD